MPWVRRETVPKAWSSTMKQGAREDAKQIKCLIADAGHVWMHYFDELPSPVRHRLAQSRHNVCTACLTLEAERQERRPSVATFLVTLAQIERALDSERPSTTPRKRTSVRQPADTTKK